MGRSPGGSPVACLRGTSLFSGVRRFLQHPALDRVAASERPPDPARPSVPPTPPLPAAAAAPALRAPIRLRAAAGFSLAGGLGRSRLAIPDSRFPTRDRWGPGPRPFRGWTSRLSFPSPEAAAPHPSTEGRERPLCPAPQARLPRGLVRTPHVGGGFRELLVRAQFY